MRAQICVGDMRVSRLQVKGRQHHLSQNIDNVYGRIHYLYGQNIGPAIAESAGPVPPPLSIIYDCKHA